MSNIEDLTSTYALVSRYGAFALNAMLGGETCFMLFVDRDPARAPLDQAAALIADRTHPKVIEHALEPATDPLWRSLAYAALGATDLEQVRRLHGIDQAAEFQRQIAPQAPMRMEKFTAAWDAFLSAFDRPQVHASWTSDEHPSNNWEEFEYTFDSWFCEYTCVVHDEKYLGVLYKRLVDAKRRG